MAASPSRPFSSLAGPIMTLVGCVAAVVGFFLPWTFTYAPNPATASTTLKTQTGWDIVTHVFSLTPPQVDSRVPSPDPTTAPTVFFLLALPMLMAVVALIATGIGMVMPHVTLKGMTIAATQIGFFALFGEALYIFLLDFYGNAPTSSFYQIGIGFPVLFLSYFLMIAGAFTHALSARTVKESP